MTDQQLSLFGKVELMHALRWLDAENFGVVFTYSSDRRLVNADDPLVLSGEAEYFTYEVTRDA